MGGGRGGSGGGGGGGGATTGGGSGGTAPKAATPRAATPMSAPPRGASSKDLLRINWDFPTYNAEPAPKTDATTAREMRRALPRERALELLSGADPRPLLVLRECPTCNKTDDALLGEGIDNERTILMARWFHCVRLPQDVIQPDHPFNALFPTNDTEHLFVAARDGAGKMPLESDTSRAELWSSMSQVLSASYAKDATIAVKEIRHAFDKLDVLDQRVLDLEKRLAELMETPRIDSAKVQKQEAEVDGAKKDVATHKLAIEKLSNLELKPVAPNTNVPAKAER